jgi:cell fate regulator YaaT (PSP1 superfamily)
VRFGRLRHLADLSPEEPDTPEPRPREACVIRTERGLELALVLAVSQGAATSARRTFVRAATAEDRSRQGELALREEHARAFARERAAKLGLALDVLGAELVLSGDRLVLLYAAADRLDLRELARSVQAEVGSRVELRQVGARERARSCGGAGVCGLTLCCSTFLRELEPVTLRMAKVQGFSLAPDATSGACGRLKCCLRYENPLYEEARAFLPRKGMHVEARRASGEVVALNVLTRQVTVRTRDDWLVTLYAAELAGAKTERVAAAESDAEPEPEKRDSRWRGITDRLNIFRRRPDRLSGDSRDSGPDSREPGRDQEKPS